jgi:hypothetical protein
MCARIAEVNMRNSVTRANGFDQTDCPIHGGETVSKSGVYEICHADEPRTTVLLVTNSVFPFCQRCGEKVRYKLVQAVPHISEDPDFKELFKESDNPPEDSSAPKSLLPMQLGLAYGFRFWQDTAQAWRDS